MTRRRVSPRRSLRTNTPSRSASAPQTVKTSSNLSSSTSTTGVRGGLQRLRVQRTYARKRPRAEAAALLASRSATVSLNTRNCGGGRISLGTKAVPLPALIGDDDDNDVSGTSGEEYSKATSRKKNAGSRKRGGRAPAKERDAAAEQEKLDEFMSQQRTFWKEVDDFDLVEEDDE